MIVQCDHVMIRRLSLKYKREKEMFSIDVMSRTPVYEQITEQVKKLIMLGILKPGDQLPSVRSLSMELSTNPNTIQKAYSELDFEGIMQSVPGKGCFVCRDALDAIRERSIKKLDKLYELATEFASAGIDKEEMLRCIDNAYTNHSKLMEEMTENDKN